MNFKQKIKEFLYRMRGDYTTESLIKKGLKVGKNFKRFNKNRKRFVWINSRSW